ncbi:hypothetical protein GCM10009554_28040 [Kribbella koreensis]|uniref:Uncharacterized protein n=2 Tax=Kribbella TaxID=182639 RepID=A0ABP6WAV5_9ACTN
MFRPSRDQISSCRTRSNGVLRTRAISVENFARDARGGGVKKSGVNPNRGCTARNNPNSSPAAGPAFPSTHGEYNGRYLCRCSTRTADIVSHNGEVPNRHRNVSA